MTWALRACGLLVALGTLSSPTLALAQATLSDVKGDWDLLGRRFRTDVHLLIGDRSIVAGLCCETRSYEMSIVGARFRATAAGVVIERGCHRQDQRSHAAWAYWNCLDRQILASTKFRIRGGRLTLVSPQGALTFARRASRADVR